MYITPEKIYQWEKEKNVNKLISALSESVFCMGAALALGKIGDAKAVMHLINVLKSDRSTSATVALGKIGDTRAVKPLIKALKDKDHGVRKAAALALGKIGDVQAAKPLKKAMKDKNIDVQNAATISLDAIHDTKKVKLLNNAFSDLEKAHESARDMFDKKLGGGFLLK